MIARLYVQLPFNITVPEGLRVDVYEYEIEGYKMRFRPLRRSEKTSSMDGTTKFAIDGMPAFQADVLQIDFLKDSFDRRQGTDHDPPATVISQAIDSFLVRLRHVTQSTDVHRLNFPSITWRIRYLNDDESELNEEEGLVRGRGEYRVTISWTALNKDIWDALHKLSFDYEPPPWVDLLLDASAQLPSIGPAVVLAATALEVFISHILDQLAVIKNVPTELWQWINQRDDRRCEPTVAEQYDDLLKFFTGHSLKEEKDLWESFKNLKTARNSFVHEGVAKIGGAAIATDRTRILIAEAYNIISRVRQWIPQELHWPEFQHDIKVEVMKQLI